MKDQRKQFFFWLGVFVLPLFWSWFTLAKAFTRRERLIAFLWMPVFVVWLLHQRSAVAGELQTVSITYPAVLGWLTVALVVWLFFRIRFVPTIIEIIVLIDVLAVSTHRHCSLIALASHSIGRGSYCHSSPHLLILPLSR